MSVLLREPGELFPDEVERLAFRGDACGCESPATHYRIYRQTDGRLTEQYLCRDCFEETR